MRPHRGLTKEGKEVKGWYVEINSKSYICNQDDVPIGICYYDKPNRERISLVSNLLGGLIPVIPETVGQSIGLKDKNIWESDIMQSEDELRRYIVTYSETEGRWYLKGIGRAWAIYPHSWDDYEVIGNIHSDPELIENHND